MANILERPGGPGLESLGRPLRIWWVRGFCTWLFVTCLMCSCGRSGVEGPSQADEGANGGAGGDLVPVKVIRPFRGGISESIRATTSIEAKREADVYSKIVGLCDRVLVEEGDSVKQGQRLAKLEDREIRLTLDQATARLEKAKIDYERAEKLHKEGLISDETYQGVSLKYRLAKTDYELAKKRLDDTSIVAPIAGVVTERRVKESDLVGTSEPLFRIVDLDALEACVHIPEQDYGRVRRGQKAILKVDAFPQESFQGTVERKSPVIDSESGTAEATISIENPRGILRPGMFVRVRILTEIHPNALIIPKEAILLEGDKKSVYVVRDGTARQVTIRTGFQDGDQVEVLEGITETDRVIVRGQLGLQGGTRVRVIAELHG